MRKRLIAGNWKMNMLRGEAGELARGVVERTGGLAEKIDIILAPPYTALGAVGDVLRGLVHARGAERLWEERGRLRSRRDPFRYACGSGCSWGHYRTLRKEAHTPRDRRDGQDEDVRLLKAGLG
jgi:hypothetical protein